MRGVQRSKVVPSHEPLADGDRTGIRSPAQCRLSLSIEEIMTGWSEISFHFCVRDVRVSNEHKEAHCSHDGRCSSAAATAAALHRLWFDQIDQWNPCLPGNV